MGKTGQWLESPPSILGDIIVRWIGTSQGRHDGQGRSTLVFKQVGALAQKA